MERKVLIAVDESINSMWVVDYAVRISHLVKDLKYTLMTIQPPIPPFLSDEAGRDSKARAELLKMRKRNEDAAEKLLEKYKARMMDQGVEKGRIDVYSQPKRLGVAQDILGKAEMDLYDALLIGRRGLTRTQQLFIGSVSNAVVTNAKSVPVWIIDGEISSMKILVAVDGSQASLRAVDHLSHMVQGNPEVEITFLHVSPKLLDYCTIDLKQEDASTLESALREEAGKCIDDFIGKARSLLSEAGISEDQVRFKSKTTKLAVARAIKDEAARGGFGTVVVGRRGEQKAFFMGSVSNKLLQTMGKCALWITV